jgi:ankyrin repeat protein
MIASPFNPKANRSCLDLVRVADYVALDAFLDGCTLVAINEQDKNGRTALTVAVLQQKLIPLQMLIDAGADLEVKDNQGKTALAHAAATRNIKSINMLLEAGAYVHPMDANGRTPLDQAELGGDDEVFELLMAASSPKKKKASGSRASSFEESKTEEADQELLRQRDVDESKEADDILRIDCD